MFDLASTESLHRLAMSLNGRVRLSEVLTPPYAALLLRIALGVVFVAHALLKLLVLTLPGAAEFFRAHGFPPWSAYVVFEIELVGGTLLIGGIYARWTALALLPVMAGAFSVHVPNGWYFARPDGGWEYIAFLSAALLVQSILGNGAFALEHHLTGKSLPHRSR